MPKPKKPKRYYALIAKEPDAKWSQQFGDYARSTVEFELNYERDHIGINWPVGTQFRIITTTDQQADINAAIAALN